MATNRSTKNKVTGFLGLIGAALTAWYFLDPKKGKERREKFSDGAREFTENTREELKRMGNEAAKGISSAVDRTGEYARQGLEKVSDAAQNAAEETKKMSERAKEKLDR